MAMSVSKPPITLRSTCTTGPHTQLLFVSKRLWMLYVNTFFTCRYLETYRKMGVSFPVGPEIEVPMPYERMSVMLWTLAVLSAIMGLLLILTAQAVPS
jgi:hypothetical protein